MLDRVRFPNGTAYFNAKLPQRTLDPSTGESVIPTIIHNNCIIGHEGKKDRFKAYHLWFVPDDWEKQPFYSAPPAPVQDIQPTHTLKVKYYLFLLIFDFRVI